VEKTCEIIPLSTNDCRGKVFEVVLEYVGGDCSGTTNDMGGNLNCTGDPGNSPVSISFPKDGATVSAIPDSGIVEGTKFTVVTTEDWFKGDLEIDVTGSGGTQSMSLHTSCSVPFLVGDQFGSLRLVGLSNSVAGTVVLPEAGTECDYTPLIAPNCIGDPQSIVFFYRGGDCNETTNDQDGHLVCSGSDPGANVSVTITKDAAKVSAFPSGGINVGDFIVFQNSDGQLAATTEFDLTGDNGTQSLAIHTNCGKPLNLGDRFGALEVGTLAFDDGSILSLSTLVEYVYTVTNNMAAPVTGISLVDDVLGEIASGFTLASGASQMFTELSVLDTTTTNTATASGSFGSVSCNGEASATVNVNPPPPTFDCSTPIDSLSMIWNGGPGAIRVKAWSAAPGSTLLADIDNIFAGDEVTVSGYAAYSGDVVWEIFVGGTETKLAQSVFNLSCSDEDMNDGSDCGKLQGDGKDGDGIFNVNALNFWIFTGLVDSDETFVCQLP